MANLPMTTKQEVVDQGQRIFERIEGALTKVKADVQKLHPVFNRANELLMPRLGNNETRRINAKIDLAYGYLAAAEMAIAELHQDGTAISVAAGTELVHTEGGPGR